MTAGLIAYFRLVRRETITVIVNQWARSKSGTLEDAFLVEGFLKPSGISMRIMAILPLWLTAAGGNSC